MKIQNGGRYSSQITCLHFLYDSNNKKLSIHKISCFYDNLNNLATNRSTISVTIHVQVMCVVSWNRYMWDLCRPMYIHHTYILVHTYIIHIYIHTYIYFTTYMYIRYIFTYTDTCIHMNSPSPDIPSPTTRVGLRNPYISIHENTDFHSLI